MLTELYDSLLSLAYPQACRICQNSVENSSDAFVCGECWAKTRFFDGLQTLCGKCGCYLHEKPTIRSAFCRQCDDHFYSRAFATGIYEFALSAAILNLKRDPFIPKKLEAIIAKRFLSSEIREPDVIIPVPLSAKRRQERGFNQAEILADAIAKTANIQVDRLSLTRKIHTPLHRVGMDRKAREMTVKNAFVVKRKNFIEGKRILLVDDVYTSGATVSNCAKILMKNGAVDVSVFTVARTF